MNALSAIDWNGVLNSVLRSMLGFSAIYVSYFIARRLVEFSRKDEGSRGFWRIIKVCGVAAIALLLIGWFFWADVSGGSVDSETGEETPITPRRAAHNF